MATAVTTWTFDTDLQGWYGSGVAWIGADGSDLSGGSAPGSIQGGAGGAAAPHVFNQFTVREWGTYSAVIGGVLTGGLHHTWEDLGVPAGQVVTGVSVRFRLKKTAQHGTPAYASASFVVLWTNGTSGFPLASLVSVDLLAVDSSWHTYSNPLIDNVSPDLGNSDRWIVFQLTVSGVNGIDDWDLMTLVDTIEITVKYGAGGITISPTSVTIFTDETQEFTANMVGNFTAPDGGTLSVGTGTSTVWSP